MTPNATEFFTQYRPKIESALADYLSFKLRDNRSQLESAITYSTLAPAKRIRPLLAIASHKLFSENTEKILPLACAIEMVHSYSLIHDDLPAMDDDKLRRGNPTCHIKYGEDIAILAGDSLNTYAFEVLATELPKHYAAEHILKIITRLATAFGINGMAGGQVLDLKADNKNFTETHLEKIHSLKTGAIITECLTCPAILENASSEDIQTLEKIGKKIGLLFQITDDILDVESTATTLGKTPGKDQTQNKLTYVTLLGLETAQKKAKETTDETLSLLNALKKETRLIQNIVTFIKERNN